MPSKNLLPQDGELYYLPSFFSSSEVAQYGEVLTAKITWSQQPIQIFGKRVLQPRLTAWCADPGVDIRYSGITYQPQAWLPCLLEIKARIQAELSHAFNGVLLNYYRDGQDSMGWHRDNERYLGPEPVIASISFGAVRTFKMRHRAGIASPLSLDLASGSLLIMRGKTQEYWEHSLPKRKRIGDSRINLTFRYIVTEL